MSKIVETWFKMRALVSGGKLVVGRNACLSWKSSIKLGRGAVLTVGDNFLLGDYALIVVHAGGEMVVGDNVSFTNHSCFYCMKDIQVGSNLGIGPYCFVIDYDHDYKKLTKAERAVSFVCAPVRVGDDAWVGAHSVILKGVSVGKQVVVGANSTVADSVEDFAVVAGNPARVIKFKESKGV